MHPKAQRHNHQRRETQRKNQRRPIGNGRREDTRHLNRREKSKGKKTPFENLYGLCRIFKRRIIEVGIAIEVPIGTNLGPCRINSKSNDRKNDIDDPDAKKLSGITLEPEAVLHRGRLGAIHIHLHPPVDWARSAVV